MAKVFSVCCFVLVLALSRASILPKFIQDLVKADEKPNEFDSPARPPLDTWALLVAGSSSWFNYRHQADVCHAYQVLRSHGVPDDHIIVMMYDDIAHSHSNPTPGVVINKPGGNNVYLNVPHDYTGENVTAENFLHILTGNKKAMEGIGSGRVIESGPNSHVFVNLVDHGAPGVFAFPMDMLYAHNLSEAIQQMHSDNRYRQMVIYVESCESGSMFEGLLPHNIRVYVTTASNAQESSYACYYDPTLQTYLGDVYSVKWMENVDKVGTDETLEKQYRMVKRETTTSHVMQYGDQWMRIDRIFRFMGSKNTAAPVVTDSKPCEDGVPSGDVPIAILAHRIAAATDEQQKAFLEHQLYQELQLRASVRSTMHSIAGAVVSPEHVTELVQSKYLPRNFTCIANAMEMFSSKCFSIPKVEYALRQVYILVNLCETVPLYRLEQAITAIC